MVEISTCSLCYPILFIPMQIMFMGGWGGYCFHIVRLSVVPSVCDVLVFQYLEKAMMEFHKIWQTLDIHKMNIYNRKIRARGQFC